MDRSIFKRQLFFFILAVLMPSAALLIFGIGFLRQESELSRNREEERRVTLASETGRLLEDRLNEISKEAASLRASGNDSLRYPVGHGLLWLGMLNGEKFQPGWSFGHGSSKINWGAHQETLTDAQALEFRENDYTAATAAYLRLAKSIIGTRQMAVALQHAARASEKAGDTERATSLALEILANPSAIQDENGIPIAFYAADMLLLSGEDSVRAAVQTRLKESRGETRWLIPERTYMLLDLARIADPTVPTSDIAAMAADSRFVEAVRADVPALIRAGISDRWVISGERLVGTGPADAAGVRDLFAVTPEDLVPLAADSGLLQGVHFDGSQDEDALSLRPYLKDVYVTLQPAPEPASILSGGFVVLGLVLIVGLTLFGGYLLWRDIRRESRLAQLRAQFVSSVSHELRTPLTSIRMFAETMLMDDETPVSERRRYLNVIANESKRLTRMLNNVLSASKIDQGASNYHFLTADLRDPANAAVEAMRYAFEQEGVVLEARIPDEPVMARIDTDAVEQAILNLLSNALKYGAGSPVTIELCDREICVTDEGPGISLKEKDLIFDRFYRSNSPQHRRVTGAGLGLSLVKHIVEAHGGQVSVASTVGSGSTFGIHF